MYQMYSLILTCGSVKIAFVFAVSEGRIFIQKSIKKFLGLFQTRATTVPNLIDRIKFDFSAKVAPRGGEVLPCLSHIGMCFPKGYGFGGFLF